MAKPSKKARARRREIRRRQEIKHRWQSRLVTVGIVALVVLVVGGFVYAAARPILVQAIPSIPLVVRSPDDVLRISPAKAKALVDDGTAVLYDTRPTDQYRSLHAAGAVSFPEDEAAARFDELPDDRDLIFY
jgi:hypothetical protein